MARSIFEIYMGFHMLTSEPLLWTGRFRINYLFLLHSVKCSGEYTIDSGSIVLLIRFLKGALTFVTPVFAPREDSV